MRSAFEVVARKLFIVALLLLVGKDPNWRGGVYTSAAAVRQDDKPEVFDILDLRFLAFFGIIGRDSAFTSPSPFPFLSSSVWR